MVNINLKNWTQNIINNGDFIFHSIRRELKMFINMKTETLEMKREVWEYFRQYRQTTIKKRYLDKLKYNDNKPTKHYKKSSF
ncbi:MAG: hypothetical protein HWN80_19370 [Candidatus Lokiarchaeota archaeon]|nr:hypothetical protein [Candidatus Lokiarchaeota archaeon]